MRAVKYRSQIKDDVIPQLIEWPSLFMHTKGQRVLSIICCVTLIGHTTIFGFLQLIHNMDFNYWMDHFFSIFAPLTVLNYTPAVWHLSFVLLFQVVNFHATLHSMMQHYCEIADTIFPQFWSLKKHGSTYAVLKKEGNTVKLYFLVVMIFNVFATASFIPLDYGYDHCAVYKYVVDRFGRHWGYLFLTPFYLSLLHGIYIITACDAFLMYIVLQVKFQLNLVTDELKRMRKIDFSHEKYFTQDKDYQARIRKELLACFKHYCLLERTLRRVNEIIFLPFFSIFSCGMIFVMAIIINVKYSADMGELFSGVLFVAGLTVFITLPLYTFPQIIQDESEKVFSSVASLPWYLWNSDNKKNVMMFLIATRTPLVFSAAGLLDLNHRLMISIFRLVYSYGTFILNI